VLTTTREPDSFDKAAPGRIERNKRAKRERIARAARRLFGRKGFEHTTTREIAEAADIGAGTLFLYVGTKEDLLVMIFRDEIGRVIADAAAAALVRPAPLLEQVMQIFGAMISHHERNFALARVFVKELPFVTDRRHAVDEVMRTLYAQLAGLVERAKARGELRAEVPAELLADNLFGLFFQTIQHWLAGRKSRAEVCRARLREKLELQLSGSRRSFRNGGVRAVAVAATVETPN
jgi:AcrR family transcriptional regulator